MANFDISFEKTMEFEGKYSNDPADVGGETYCGISRVFHPDWPGWLIVDATKPNVDYRQVKTLVKSHYKTFYWNPNRLSDFPQDVADKLFDIGVNLGTRRAAKFLQRALNYLNKNGELFPDLVDDGVIGPKTMSAFRIIEERGDIPYLLIILSVLQGQHYLNYMKKSPLQEKFARGWLKRVFHTNQ